MELEKALGIVTEVVALRAKWGKYANPPYTQHELIDAIVILHKAGRFDAPTDEEITKMRRQLAAANAREAARREKQ